MSAAEPVVPPPPPMVNAGDDAAVVIDINARRAGRGAQHPGGWSTVDTPPTPVPDPSVPSISQSDRENQLRLLAEDMEMAFHEIGNRTLTDRETALVFVHTLRLVDHALKGAAAKGIISEEQRQELAVLFGGMAEAPRLV